MSAADDEREPAAPDRRRFLKRAGAIVAAAPVVAAIEATAQTKSSARSEDPFPGARPDASIARNAEERAVLERRWKSLQDVLKVVRQAPLDPATEPAAAFAALPLPPRDRRARDEDDEDRDGED